MSPRPVLGGTRTSPGLSLASRLTVSLRRNREKQGVAIAGIGIDILDIARVARALSIDPQFGKALGFSNSASPTRGCIDRLNAAQKAALAFSAREAAVKATGVKFERTSWLGAVEVRHDGSTIQIEPGDELARQMSGLHRWHVTFAVRGPFVVTLVLLERLDDGCGTPESTRCKRGSSAPRHLTQHATSET